MARNFQKFAREKNERFKFSDMGQDHPIIKVNDMSQASNKLTISTESVSFSAGAAGTTGVVGLDKAPVMDGTGALVGNKDDTSFSWTTGTVLTTEVEWDYEVSDTTQLAALSNGEFALDYVSGKIRYCKATTGTSDTANYDTRQTNIEITGSTSTVTPNVNINQVAGTSTNVNGGNRDAGTQTTTLADDDPAVTALEIMDDWDNAASDGASVSGDVAHDAVDAGEPVKVGGYASSTAPTAVAGADRVNAWFDLNGRQQVTAQGYDSGTDSMKSFEVSPLSSHHVEETATLTNVANATPEYIYIDMDGYRYVSIQIAALTGTDTQTFTLEMTNQDDGTAAADCTYQDVTQALTGVASVTAVSYWIIDTALAGKYLRVKDTTSGAADDGDVTCYIKKMY